MFWIIVAILIVGYFIVKAIQRQTMVNAQIALQQQEQARQQIENTPEYKQQREVSTKYFDMLSRVTDNGIYVAREKIRLIAAPSDATNRAAAKKRIAELEKYTKELQRDYEKTKAEYKGFNPESMEVTASKYGLDQTYSGDDWIRWDGQLGEYRDNQEKLRILESRLAELEKDGSHESGNPLVMAMQFMLNNGEADSWQLARALGLVDNAKAKELLETLKHKGLAHFNDRAFPMGQCIPSVTALKAAQAKLG